MCSKANSNVVGREMDSKYIGKVISVKFGEDVKRIGIEGSSEAIVDAIKVNFGLRTKRLFWLQDENGVIRSIDRNMPLGNYTLHLDDGITVEICQGHPSHIKSTKTVYDQDDLSTFLVRHHWIGLEGPDGYNCIDSIEYLVEGELYHGIRMKNA